MGITWKIFKISIFLALFKPQHIGKIFFASPIYRLYNFVKYLTKVSAFAYPNLSKFIPRHLPQPYETIGNNIKETQGRYPLYLVGNEKRQRSFHISTGPTMYY